MPSNIFDPSITARFMFLVERLPSHLFLQAQSQATSDKIMHHPSSINDQRDMMNINTS
jgi:hypothetical protein